MIHAIDCRLRAFAYNNQEFAKLLGASLQGMRDIPGQRVEIQKAMRVFGADAAPLVVVSGLAVGLVLALEWGLKLEMFGAKLLMGNVMAVSVVREIGPIITGIMVAGRTGAKMAAEIGAMRVTDQIDALRAMGVDPIHRLVMPRQLASTVTLFPLTLMADAVGILAGSFVAVHWLDMPSHFFWTAVFDSLGFKDLAVGLVKPFVFGYVIATISAYCGLHTRGGSSGVGAAATRAVMYGSLSVLILDFLLGKLTLAVFG